MQQPTPAQQKEIAEQLSMGFRAFMHKDKDEFLFFPDRMQYMDEDFSAWQQEIDKVEENPDDYIEIEKWTSGDAFRIMSDFAEEVKQIDLKNRLFQALNNRKPFRGFRFIVDNHGDLREDWFAFRDKRQQEFVRRQFFTDFEEQD